MSFLNFLTIWYIEFFWFFSISYSTIKGENWVKHIRICRAKKTQMGLKLGFSSLMGNWGLTVEIAWNNFLVCVVVVVVAVVLRNLVLCFWRSPSQLLHVFHIWASSVFVFSLDLFSGFENSRLKVVNRVVHCFLLNNDATLAYIMQKVHKYMVFPL